MGWKGITESHHSKKYLPGISSDIFSLSEEIRLHDSGLHEQEETVHSVSSSPSSAAALRNVRVLIVRSFLC